MKLKILLNTDFHFVNNILYINKNLKFLLHPDQHSDKFTILNGKLDINKEKLIINRKSLMKMDSAGNFKGSIMVDSSDKLKLNYNSDF